MSGGFLLCSFERGSRVVVYDQTGRKQGQASLQMGNANSASAASSTQGPRALVVDHLARFVVSALAAGRLRVHSLATGVLHAEVRTPHDRGIGCMALDETSTVLAVGGDDGVVSLWDFGALVGSKVPSLSASGGSSGGFGSNPNNLAASSAIEALCTISDHHSAVTTVRLTPGGLLLTASQDASVRLYRATQPALDQSSSGGAGSGGFLGSSASGSGGLITTPTCLWTHSFRAPATAAVLDPAEQVLYVAVRDSVMWVPLYARGSSAVQGERSVSGKDTQPP
jgi:WD40 repeat protein